MRQKKYINIIIVIVTSALLVAVWFRGVDWVYARAVTIGANVCLVFSDDTSVSLKMANKSPNFVVKTVIDGKKGSYPQKADLILLPFIMILTWQILLFFNVERKKAIRSAIENLLAFYLVQVIYVLLLTGYYGSSTIKFVYDLLMDSFYIIVLFLIVKDTFKLGLIHVPGKAKNEAG